ncbi:MAG: zf-HC2 domain-containing protein [Firmicutes bacterium]|jgi:anti-sigma factor RsiW|nr:zf-HC2 domain-containing protein [Bacillota bacterium]
MRTAMASQMTGKQMHLDDEIVGLYLDGELPVERRPQIEAHLASCEQCRKVLLDLKRLGEAVRAEALPEWDVEAMVQGVTSGITRRERESAAGRRALAERGAACGFWSSLRGRIMVGAAAAVIALVSVFGAMGYFYRKEMMAQEEAVIRSHYVVTSGQVGVVLVSAPASSPGVR